MCAKLAEYKIFTSKRLAHSNINVLHDIVANLPGVLNPAIKSSQISTLSMLGFSYLKSNTILPSVLPSFNS